MKRQAKLEDCSPSVQAPSKKTKKLPKPPTTSTARQRGAAKRMAPVHNYRSDEDFNETSEEKDSADEEYNLPSKKRRKVSPRKRTTGAPKAKRRVTQTGNKKTHKKVGSTLCD